MILTKRISFVIDQRLWDQPQWKALHVIDKLDFLAAASREDLTTLRQPIFAPLLDYIYKEG